MLFASQKKAHDRAVMVERGMRNASSRDLGNAQLLDGSEGAEGGVLSAPGFFSSLFALRRDKGVPVRPIPLTDNTTSSSDVRRILSKLGIGA